MNRASIGSPRRKTGTIALFLVCASGALAQGYPITSVNGPAASSALGGSVAGGGDADGDLVPDPLIGGRGLVVVLSGTTGIPLHTIPSANVTFGAALDYAGDVNGDGLADILVGAPSGGTAGTGQAFLLSGATGATLLSFSYTFSPGFGGSVAGIGDVNLDGVPDLAIGGSSTSGAVLYSGATGALLFSVAVNIAPLGFAFRPVARIGDLDGDGRADVLVGLPPQLSFASPPGAATVYSGANGAVLLSITGATPEFGYAVAGVGDVTGDGVPDFVVGAPRTWPFLPAGPGYAQIISGATGAVVATLAGLANGDQFGASVAGVGDVDGDGVRDVIVGAPGLGAGYARIFNALTGELLLTLPGVAALDAFGASVAGAGDVTGDGIPDLIVGAPGADSAGLADSGRGSILSYAGIPGGSTLFGAGCPGSASPIPVLSTGGGVPVAATGNPAFRLLLSHARPSAVSVLELGFSATAWGSTPLPFSLAPYGMPACTQLVSPDFFFPVYTTAGAPGTGRGVVPIPLPADPTLAGATAFLQWYVVDPGPAFLPGSLTAALQVTVQ